MRARISMNSSKFDLIIWSKIYCMYFSRRNLCNQIEHRQHIKAHGSKRQTHNSDRTIHDKPCRLHVPMIFLHITNQIIMNT